MPIYNFKCPAGDAMSELVLPMSQSNDAPTCGLCGRVMQRDYRAEHAHVAPDSYDKVRWSDSLAVAPCQIAEHRRLFPDVRIDSEGRPGFESYPQQDAYLEKTGHVKIPAKRGKRRGTKI